MSPSINIWFFHRAHVIVQLLVQEGLLIAYNKSNIVFMSNTKYLSRNRREKLDVRD